MKSLNFQSLRLTCRFLSSLFLLIFFSQVLPAGQSNLSAHQQVMEQVIRGFNEKIPENIVRNLDSQAILDKALSDLPLAPRFKKGFIKGFKGSFGQIGNILINGIPESGYAKLLRLKRDRSYVNGLVRIDYGDRGYSYVDFISKKRWQNKNCGLV